MFSLFTSPCSSGVAQSWKTASYLWHVTIRLIIHLAPATANKRPPHPIVHKCADFHRATEWEREREKKKNRGVDADRWATCIRRLINIARERLLSMTAKEEAVGSNLGRRYCSCLKDSPTSKCVSKWKNKTPTNNSFVKFEELLRIAGGGLLLSTRFLAFK
jgi:hypothetical protein